MLIQDGVYVGRVTDVSLWLRGDNERLSAAFRVEVEGKVLVKNEWIELNDGTISDKTIHRLRECFPAWDGSIESLESGTFLGEGFEVSVTIEQEPDKNEPDKYWTVIKWMNPAGSGTGAAKMPDKAAKAKGAI